MLDPAVSADMPDTWNILRLSDGQLHLDVLPGVGGRLWDIRIGNESLLFQNPDLAGIEPDLKGLSNLPTRSPQFAFPLWGGEKTWIAPDRAWRGGAPYPVLDTGAYSVLSSDARSVRMQSRICPVSGLQVERRITLDTRNSWTIRHSIKNFGPDPRLAGIWPVMMLRQPAAIGLETGRGSTAAPVFGDASGCIAHSGAFILTECSRPQEFKVAMRNRSGRVLVRFDFAASPLWLTCTTVPWLAHADYAHGLDFEVFNSGDYPYCEAEWHSPARAMAPEESLAFEQNFTAGTENDVFTGSGTSLKELELMTCMS